MRSKCHVSVEYFVPKLERLNPTCYLYIYIYIYIYTYIVLSNILSLNSISSYYALEYFVHNSIIAYVMLSNILSLQSKPYSPYLFLSGCMAWIGRVASPCGRDRDLTTSLSLRGPKYLLTDRTSRYLGSG